MMDSPHKIPMSEIVDLLPMPEFVALLHRLLPENGEWADMKIRGRRNRDGSVTIDYMVASVLPKPPA